MDVAERLEAEDRLALLEALLIAQERRHDVIDVVWGARDEDEAGVRIGEVLGLGASVPPGIVLDMQIRRLTSEARAELTHEVAQLRGVLSRGRRSQ